MEIDHNKLVSTAADPEPEVEIQLTSDEEARLRILALFNEHPGSSLYYDDIAEQLRLPLRQTVEICDHLESEGLIGEPANQ